MHFLYIISAFVGFHSYLFKQLTLNILNKYTANFYNLQKIAQLKMDDFDFIFDNFTESDFAKVIEYIFLHI